MTEVPDSIPQIRTRSRPNSIPPSNVLPDDRLPSTQIQQSTGNSIPWEEQFYLSDKLQLSEPDVRYSDKKIKVLILNHYRFDDLNKKMNDFYLNERDGSSNDVKELKEIFESPKFNVSICQEDENNSDLKLTKSKVISEINKVVEEMAEYDQLIIIASSHGNIQALATYDDIYNISEFLDILRHENLEGKPKFIILNACRVDEFDKKTKTTKRIDDDYFCELDLEDCLLVYGAYPGKEAYRDTVKGGRLLRSFRIAMRKLKEKNEERLLFDLFNDIKRHVSTQSAIDLTQMPIVTNNLTKRLYIGTCAKE